MSLSLRALATSTSWPQSSSTLLAQGEWVPASMAMRIGGRSEEKRRLKASGLVRSLPSSITSPLCESMRHRRLYLSPRSNPAVIFGRPLLPSMVGRSSFHFGPLEPGEQLQTQRVLRRGSAFSSHLLRTPSVGEVRRIPLPRTRVNSTLLPDGRLGTSFQ